MRIPSFQHDTIHDMPERFPWHRQPWRPSLGATPEPGGVRFRVWAPKRTAVDVVIDGRPVLPLSPEGNGYFSRLAEGSMPGALYKYRVDENECYPDPCSRYQPYGPHGSSMVTDPSVFRWSDAHWKGTGMKGQVIYELHVGAFTPEGTFRAAVREFEELRKFGITAVELMPVAECPGRWNWGYDGVNLFAPYHVYGTPDDLKFLVDSAHRLGLAVILDVVYNHLGPDGCYVHMFSDTYFSERHKTEWGGAINYDGPGSGGVRDFVVQNACYWVSEFHFDGLRLDATQTIFDDSPEHILAELSRNVRLAVSPREVLLIAENETQNVLCITPRRKGGYGLDAVWNDDFHHAARVAMTGFREAYLTDYRGTAQELLSAVKRGYLFQGQYYLWHDRPRGGRVGGQPGYAFVHYLDNHDQIANHLEGERIHALTGLALYRAMATLMLLTPGTPLFFMGQEFGASAPFVFFVDIPSLAAQIIEGRRRFVGQFPSYRPPERFERLLDPNLESTYRRSKINWSERDANAALYGFHRDLLALRRTDPAVAAQSRDAIDGAVLSPHVLVLRFFGGDDGDRLLLLNFGDEFTYRPLAEPLLAPLDGLGWKPVFSSDDVRYGGNGRGDVMPAGAKALTLPERTAFFYSS